MRILQVIDNLQMTGGAQKLQVLFAQALSERADVELTVLSLQDDSHSPLPAKLEQAGARVAYLPGKKLIDPLRFRRLAAFIGRGRYDVVHTHLTFSNILGVSAARFNRTPTVTSVHNERNQKRRYYGIKNRVELYLLCHVTDEVIAVGHSAAEAYRPRLGGKPIRVVPNAIEMPAPLTADERVALRAELAGDPNRPLVVSVGRLVAQKAFDDMITAFAQLCTLEPRAQLCIIGGGVLESDLRAQIDSLGMQDNIRLLGLRSDVPRVLAASDLFVNSSLWEGLSMAMLEAMAAGLPVVATAVGDAPRLVVDGAGCLTPPGRPDLLADALAYYLADPQRRSLAGEVARAQVRRLHDPQVWAQGILDVYDLAITRRSRQ